MTTPLRNLSIQHKQTLVVLVTAVVALILAASSIIVYDRILLRQSMLDHIRTLANVLGSNSTGALDFNDAKAAQEILSALASESHIVAASLHLANGQTLASYPPARARLPLPGNPAYGSVIEGRQLSLLAPIIHRSDRVGSIALVMDLGEFNQHMRQFARAAALAMLLAILVAFLLSFWLQRLISTPILRLVQAIRRVTEDKDYATRVLKENEDELGILTDKFNEMLAQLQLRDEVIRAARAELEQRVADRTQALQSEITERLKAESLLTRNSARLQQVIDSLLRMGDDHDANINQLVTLCGRVLNASCALFNRLQDNELHTVDHWNLPTGYALCVEAGGQICTDVIRQNSSQVVVITGLQQSSYAETDPNVRRHGVETYMGHVVRSEGQVLGSLCVVYTSPCCPGADEQRLLSLIALAVGNEDKRKQTEEQFRQVQKMEAVGQLAGGVAHDFNNILAASMLQLNLLLEDTTLPHPVRSALMELNRDSERAADLTRQLLMFSQRHQIKMAQLDLNRILSDLLKMLGRILGETIQLAFKPAPAPLWVEADSGKIQQIVMNLCVNARDAMPQGGTLVLTTSEFTLDEATARDIPDARPGRYACLAVSDNGCGMTEQVRSRIFEPFFTTKGVGRGTGLGLSTVYGIVHQHHGWIQVRSEVGQGTEFRVFIPALPGEPALDREENQRVLHHGKGTILVVEDDAGVRGMVVLSLRHLGYHVLESATGEEALRLWAERGRDIDLLFTDMIMPGSISGAELALTLKTSSPSLKIIISSGYSMENNHLDVAWEHDVTYLPKPYSAHALASVVSACLDPQAPAPDRRRG